MKIHEFGLDCLWAGLFATAIAILLTCPRRHLVGTFVCAVVGRATRDLLVDGGMNQIWATVLAAAVIVPVGVAVIREHEVSPGILISGVLPLGAAVAIFETIAGVLRISTLQGQALEAAATKLSADAGKAFTVSLAIALGNGVGRAVVALATGRGIRETA